MGAIRFNNSVVNRGNVPAMSSGNFADRPNPGLLGAVYFSVDTQEIFRDNGATWDLLASVGGGGGGSYIAIDRASALLAVAGSSLVPGALYKITDASYGQGIFLDAISVNQFSQFGLRLQPCPLTYARSIFPLFNWRGVYRPYVLYNVGDYAIHGGRVWLNLNGNAGSAIDPIELDPVEWQLQTPDSVSGLYTVELFGIDYDFANDYIRKQWDEYGNVCGAGDPANEYYALPFVDVTDWKGWKTTLPLTSDPWINNEVIGFLNNIVYGGGFTFSKNRGGVYSEIRDNGSDANGAEIRDNYSETGIYENNYGVADPFFNCTNNIVHQQDISGNVATSIIQNHCRGINNNTVVGGNGIFRNHCDEIRGNICDSIYRNRLNGDILSNNNVAMRIFYNIATDSIRQNTCGDIFNNNIRGTINGNSNSGTIAGNGCGNISFNTLPVNSIFSNLVRGVIGNNGNSGSIYENSCEYITNNANSGDIGNNSNATFITANTADQTNIIYNSNTGNIFDNRNIGAIRYNKNNGNISQVHNLASDIEYNTNNGSITGAAGVGVISDPIVNK